ncbi:hypothetical protein K227x_03630 [Rubripirellula lacrimiformis]|uniref:Arylsulfotransferase (ASST) n=1 Tax=Rubripirellula lacrimiformis TaxID=1930273 RepID=A0A517N4E1_9BACT|nr:hypothetical protein [Rubripirellula lacrimiformis]QDT01992.1 hypothetical protein K227x_03630 [Rubripirellula lacrimiformis]
MHHALTTIIFAAFATAGLVQAKQVDHSFLACGQQTYIMGADGKRTWTYPHSTRDGYVAADGTITLTLSRSKQHPGGAVVQIDPQGTESLLWKGTQAEVNSAQPTADGTYVITEAGPKPRLLEIDQDGKVLVQFPLDCQTKDNHHQTRMARKLDDGTYLAPHLFDFEVVHYSSDGKVLGRIDTTLPGDPDRKVHTWPFTAIRHGDGKTLVACTNGNQVIDFDADGKIVWQLTNDDLPGPWLQDPCGCQLLPNGNVVVACYAGGRKDVNAPKLFEVTPDKEVVWVFGDGKKSGIHHFQIIDTNGEPLKRPAMK